MSVPEALRLMFWTVSCAPKVPEELRASVPPAPKLIEPLPRVAARSWVVALSCNVPPARATEAFVPNGVAAPVKLPIWMMPWRISQAGAVVTLAARLMVPVPTL